MYLLTFTISAIFVIKGVCLTEDESSDTWNSKHRLKRQSYCYYNYHCLHGYCINWRSSCTCDDCWTGINCNVPACCQSNTPTCLNGGRPRCVGNVNTCDCTPGWTGSHCQYIDCTTPVRCQNNGICRVTAGGDNYTCECPNGWRGRNCEIREPYCNPPCQHNGTCIGIQTCACPYGVLGQRCELGREVQEKLLPTLNSSTVSINNSDILWYDTDDQFTDGLACFVKVGIENAPINTILKAVSTPGAYTDEPFGYFTVGPIDSNATVNGTDRFACLQVRCPGLLNDGRSFDTVVNVSVENESSGRCRVTTQSPLSTNVDDQGDGFSFILKQGDNYGSRFGVYYGTGNRYNAIYFGTRECYSGREYDWVSIRPYDGNLVKFMC